MLRWTIRLIVALSVSLVLGALVGAIYQSAATRKELDATPAPGQLVDIGSHRLHLWCTGAGTPAVFFESGLGGSAADWGYVQPEVARFTRACSYDRAGMGYSDPGPSPRTARRIASELATLASRSQLDGPLVIVGASIGGLNIRVFASDYPDRVAGLVLVDASHEDQAHEIPGLARFAPFLSKVGALRVLGMTLGPRVESLAPQSRPFARATSFRAAGVQAAASEITHILETAAEVRSSRRTLNVPVVVITGARGADATWQRLQQDQVTLSARGCQIVAKDSGHTVPVEQPEVVVEAIKQIVIATRGQITDGHDLCSMH